MTVQNREVEMKINENTLSYVNPDFVSLTRISYSAFWCHNWIEGRSTAFQFFVVLLYDMLLVDSILNGERSYHFIILHANYSSEILCRPCLVLCLSTLWTCAYSALWCCMF